MYLQLAENSSDMYQPIETNQGTLYVRPDLLSAAGIMKPGAMALKLAPGQLIKKAAPTLIKTGVKGLPGGAAAGVALDLIKKGAQAIKAKRDAKKAEAAAADKAAAEQAAASTEAIKTDKSKRNRMFLIGGGILAAGVLVYLLTRKK